jgi:putative endonuclease
MPPTAQVLIQRLPASWRRWLAPRSLGYRGEIVADRFLRRKGYKIVARGRRSPWGELDLVAVDGQTIVFVEVKTRRSHDAGHPADAVSARKQRQLTRLALSYLEHHGLLGYACRFDVVAVTWPERGRPLVEHFAGAFEPTGVTGLFS